MRLSFGLPHLSKRQRGSTLRVRGAQHFISPNAVFLIMPIITRTTKLTRGTDRTTSQEKVCGVSVVYALCVFLAQSSPPAQHGRVGSYVRGPDRSNDPFLTLRREQREGTVVSFLPDKAWN